MNIQEMIDHAAECLTAAQETAMGATEKAEIDPAKTSEKVQRVGYVADQWMKLASVTAEVNALDVAPPAGT